MKTTLYAPLIFLLLISISLTQTDCSGGKSGETSAADSTAVQSDSSGVTENDTTKSETDKEKPAEDRIPVEVATISRGDISSYILLSSNLETEKMADVYSRVQGLVDKIYVEEGHYVKKGQVLMSLEAHEYALAEERAHVNYQQKKNAFERIDKMYNKELLSKEEYEQAKFTADGARIEWEQAKLNLDFTRITAPISGFIAERLRRLGDRIQPIDKLFTVINTDEMIAVVYVPEKEIETISKGQQAFITSTHLKSRQFTGWVKRVSPAVDPQSGTFKVTIGVRNMDNRLRPGMFVNTHIITSTHESTILIPKSAIVYENENMNVYVVRDSLAHKITINPGFQDYEKVESLSDIDEGEKVIVVGQAGLKDQTKVKIVLERDI
ncbi:MAG: efflux RND transporter periplasmic adaptor subunit [candidate division KSB1 bacterium]|jgi:membrane fusion protein (multidrug efflux system)|nr:efflux RND transporter periplasmic adaptor subunit [candidate division KSB1 bacterium]